ncbi:unnamed protein product, partial [marine sediment metagenome]
ERKITKLSVLIYLKELALELMTVNPDVANIMRAFAEKKSKEIKI